MALRNPFVLVHWRDAIGDRHEERDPPHCCSAGWLIEANESHVRIASEIIQDGSYCEITTIPAGMVQKVIRLRTRLPKPFDTLKRLDNSG